MTDQRRVVITGLGVISSIGQDVETYWRSLVAGRSGIKAITSFDASEFTTKIAGEICDFEATQWIEKRLANRLDRFAQMGLAASKQAVEDAGISFDTEDPSRCGVMIGSGIGGLHEIEAQHKRLLAKGPSRVSPFLVPKLMANACSGQVSITLGIMGPNMAAVTACASSNHSIGQAFRAIRHDDADIMVAGGSEAALSPLGIAGFCSAKALSTRNGDPEKASRPFDNQRDGFVMGEGAGIIILEELDHARKRNARIYAEFMGFGLSSDGKHLVEPDPAGTGAALSMKAALRNGHCNPDEITYVNAHGTSTILGDKGETAAIKLALGDAAKSVVISSTKSMIGHLLGASGGAEIVATVMCIQHGVIHPTINYEEPDPDCDLDYVPNIAREVEIKRAMSNSFGFGGHNASLLIGKFLG